jgi:predicted choloylglycine hydrolase
MNKRKYTIENVSFHHLVLEGTQYEVGRQLGQMIETIPGAKEFATSGKIDLKRTGFASLDELWDYSETCCPGIMQEIQGFADHFKVSPDKVPFWHWTFSPSLRGECSQFAVLSSITQDQHTYVGRSYEWNHKEDDLRLITTRVKGKYAHIGFSCLFSGRYEGMNEHGLVVSMSGGGIFGVKFKHKGPMFWLTIRAILDNCTSVDNALEYLKTIPVTGYLSLLFADKQDNAVIVELADGKMSTCQIFGQDTEPFIYSVNHFRSPDMEEYNSLNCGIITHSRIREKLINDWYHFSRPEINKKDIRSLLATQHPGGLCNHFYNSGFGTLWSMIFDLTKASIDIHFGAPTHNPCHTFDLAGNRGITEYPAVIPITEWY